MCACKGEVKVKGKGDEREREVKRDEGTNELKWGKEEQKYE